MMMMTTTTMMLMMMMMMTMADPGFEEHELLALFEFVERHGRRVEWLSVASTPAAGPDGGGSQGSPLFEWGAAVSASCRIW